MTADKDKHAFTFTAAEFERWLEELEKEIEMNRQELINVLELAVKMRNIQREYFRTRDPRTLRLAQQIERDFDRQAKAVLDTSAGNPPTQGRLIP